MKVVAFILLCICTFILIDAHWSEDNVAKKRHDAVMEKLDTLEVEVKAVREVTDEYK